MIYYDNHGIEFLAKLLRMRGSVFKQAILVSIPCAVIALTLEELTTRGYLPYLEHASGVLEASVWAGFNGVVGFLIIFRTSQSYNRFWEGCQASHKMGAEWFAACSALFSFCKHSEASQEKITHFQNVLVRLFSMLHAAALGEIEDMEDSERGANEMQAFMFELIDAAGVDVLTLEHIREEESKVELIFQWISNLVVENIKTGVLSIPPPILTRAFQEMEAGMVVFHDAFKLSRIPFPFPYAQTCDALLICHWIMSPFMACFFIEDSLWVCVFTFVQVFIFWALDFIAVEIENPFGMDANDLDARQMQREMNRRLCLLLRPHTQRTPKLTEHFIDYSLGQDLLEMNSSESSKDWGARRSDRSFIEVWKSVQHEGPGQRGSMYANRRYSSRAARGNKYRKSAGSGPSSKRRSSFGSAILEEAPSVSEKTIHTASSEEGDPGERRESGRLSAMSPDGSEMRASRRSSRDSRGSNMYFAAAIPVFGGGDSSPSRRASLAPMEPGELAVPAGREVQHEGHSPRTPMSAAAGAPEPALSPEAIGHRRPSDGDAGDSLRNDGHAQKVPAMVPPDRQLSGASRSAPPRTTPV